MKNKPLQIILSLVSLAIGVWLIKLAYAGQNIDALFKTIQTIDLFWVGVIFICTLLCHVIRALRWKLLLDSCNIPVNLFPLFLSMMSGYLVSLAIPRVGEIVRCYLLKRSDKVDFSIAFGTILSERIIDMAFLILLIIMCATTQGDILYAFYAAHIKAPLAQYAQGISTFKLLAIGAGVLGIIYLLISHFSKSETTSDPVVETAPKNQIDEFVDGSFTGLSALGRLNKPYLFSIYSIAIWILYFLMTYLWFFSIAATNHLGLASGLFVMVIGSIGRSLPIQGGGVGAYHYLVINALAMLGIATLEGGAIALMIHGFQAFFYLLIGGLSILIFLLVYKPVEIPSAGVNKEIPLS